MTAASDRERPSGPIRTVQGDVPSAPWGPTNAHAHLVADLWSHHRDPRYSDFVLDLDDMLRELHEYREAGGFAVVEVTPMGLGRDPVKLLRATEQAGVTVVAGTGIYHDAFHPSAIAGRSAEQICELLVREVNEGMDGTGVRAGIIGEIGTNRDAMTVREEAVFRAAAWAANETGVAVTTHTYFGELALDQIDVLTAEGLEPERIVIGHLDDLRPIDLDICRSVIERGAWAQFDAIGCDYYSETLGGQLPSDGGRVTALLQLAAEGFADRMILASDICRRRHLRSEGGPGLSHLVDGFRRLARDEGVPEALLHRCMVENPATVLTMR